MKVSRPGPRPLLQSQQVLRNAASGTVTQSADAECRLIPAPHTDAPAPGPAADASPIAVRAGARRPATVSCGGARSDRLVVRRIADGDGDDAEPPPPLLRVRDAEPLFRGRFLVAVDMVTSERRNPPGGGYGGGRGLPSSSSWGARGRVGGEWREASGEATEEAQGSGRGLKEEGERESEGSQPSIGI